MSEHPSCPACGRVYGKLVVQPCDECEPHPSEIIYAIGELQKDARALLWAAPTASHGSEPDEQR